MRTTFAFISALLTVGILPACSVTPRVYPMDEAAARAGIPKVQFKWDFSTHGPASVVMPDGEVLTGEFQVTNNHAIGVGFAGGRTATAVAAGSGRAVVVSATGDRGTIMNCEGTADLEGHGSVICNSNKGGSYRVMF